MPCLAATGVGEAAFATPAQTNATAAAAFTVTLKCWRIMDGLMAKKRGAEAPL
jgi:hypothetical protein